jgi:hypothetical protein
MGITTVLQARVGFVLLLLPSLPLADMVDGGDRSLFRLLQA